MKKKLTALLLAVFLMTSSFVGCNNDSGNKPNPTPTPGEEEYVPTEKEQTQPIVFGIDGADGVFSPFFSSAAYDSEITGMTQIGMLTSREANYAYGDDEACITKDVDITYLNSSNQEVTDASKAAYTRYDFLIKKGIKFSDGVDLTIKDVLFNLYVYLDPAYTGSSTIYSTDIVGLSQYRTQSLNENASATIESGSLTNTKTRMRRIYDWLNNQALLETSPDHSYEKLTANQKRDYVTGLDTYEAEIIKDINFFIPLFKQEVETDFGSAQSSFEEMCKEYNFDEGEYWEYYMYMYGYLRRKTDINDNPVKETFIVDGKEVQKYVFDWDDYGFLKDDVNDYVNEHCEAGADKETVDAAKKAWAIDYVFKANVGKQDVFDPSAADYWDDMWAFQNLANTVYGSASTTELTKEIQANERSKIINENEDSYKTTSVSGITTYTTNKFRNEKTKTEYKLDGTYDVLSIKINKIDPKAIWNFSFTVAPLHYYSYEGAGDEGEWNVNNYFGVKFNSTDFMNNVLKESEKLGVPVGAGAYKASTEKGIGEGQYPSKTEFKKNNRVYYERNTYFDLLDGVEHGGKIQNAKIKYFQYKIVNSSFLLSSLQTNEIDVGTPNATLDNINKVAGIDHLTNVTTTTNGYGYVGINAKEIPDVWMRRAIIKAMNTQMLTDYYKGGLCDIIYRPMSTQSWAYPENAKSVYKFTYTNPQGKSETVDYAYDASGVEIVKMLANHGYETTSDYTKVLRDPDGNSLKEITFTVAGESTDHPAYQMFTNAKLVLEKIGFRISVKTDQFALKKLASGQLAVWAAAWSSTIDPDMYQVYHKDSQAGSTLNWGYNAIKEDKGKYSYEWNLIDTLSGLIDKGRSYVDSGKNSSRAQVYAQALDLVMQLAVEMPTYQRKDLTVYNKDKIDASTLNQNPTAFDGVFSRLWEVGYTK